MKATKPNIDKLLKVIEKADKILITSHRDPDYDAASSVLSMYWILKSLKKTNVEMLLEDPQPLTEEYLAGAELIKRGQLSEVLGKFDLVFLLDAGMSNRFAKEELNFDKSQKIVRIDHHVADPDIDVDLDFTNSEAPSTCELIYYIFKDSVPVSSVIAKALLTGIIDDTNNFSIRGVTKNTLEAAYDLLEKGANISEVSEYIKQYDADILAAVQEILANLQFDSKWKYAFSFITRDTYDDLKITDLKMDKIMDLVTDFLLGMKGYRWGLVVRPKDENDTKLSLRSRYKAQNVRLIAEHLGGGGHNEAAGATFEDIDDPYEALAITRKKIDEFLKGQK